MYDFLVSDVYFCINDDKACARTVNTLVKKMKAAYCTKLTFSTNQSVLPTD